MMLLQSYCGYNKAKVLNQSRQQELTELIRSLSRKKSRKLRAKLWDVHEFLRPSNLESLKEKLKATQLRGDLLLSKNPAATKKPEPDPHLQGTQDSIESSHLACGIYGLPPQQLQ